MLLDMGLGQGGMLPSVPVWERMALLFCLAECYSQMPPPGASSR
jgi:hypothetical protein